MIKKIIGSSASKKEEILKVYNDLHAIPELSTQEYKTSAYISDYLRKNDFDVTTGIAGTGLTACVTGSEPGPVLAIRADMDALNHIIDGKKVPMHSCGHDAHSTMGLFAGIIAKELSIVKRGALKLIFQPSEESETTSGARAMAKAGVMDEVDMCVGIHLRPKEEAQMGEAISALRHGALTIIVATIHGETSHSGRPHMGKNPIDAMAAIINAINAIWIDPTIPSSAKLIAINAGDARTTSIPELGQLAVDLRANTNESMTLLIDKVYNAILTGASTVGCKAEVTVVPGLPAAVYDDNMIQIASQSIVGILGDKGLLGERTTTGSEDFHEFTKFKPSLRTTYLGLGCDLVPGLHNPEMTFNKDAMLNGINILVNMAYKILG
ncbi:MAG TPA: amidohydrolase [Clostridiales bacterium]|jgi:amidohydrolase|nr:amidohydrolase [Clostridiales bacterium]